MRTCCRCERTPYPWQGRSCNRRTSKSRVWEDGCQMRMMMIDDGWMDGYITSWSMDGKEELTMDAICLPNLGCLLLPPQQPTTHPHHHLAGNQQSPFLLLLSFMHTHLQAALLVHSLIHMKNAMNPVMLLLWLIMKPIQFTLDIPCSSHHLMQELVCVKQKQITSSTSSSRPFYRPCYMMPLTLCVD